MRISKIETIYFEGVAEAKWRAASGATRQAMPNNLWVRIYTEDGLVGLGETYYVPRAIAAIIHDVFAPLLVGREAFDIENHWNNMFSLVNFCGWAGAEMRALSALDIALWDIAGQATGQPIYNLLGGRSRDRVEIYNTCVSSGKYDDLNMVSDGRAGEVAESLVKQGIRGMKIWPFDKFATTLAGPTNPYAKFVIWGGETAAGVRAATISNDGLARGLSVLEDIRKAVGDKISIAIEAHSRWDLPTAIRIARSMEPYNIMWLEEIMPPDNVDSYVRLKSATTVRICQSERVFTRFGYRPWIEKNAADIIMPDLSWGGGITEGRKIASMADTYFLPVTCHDTIGPVALWAASHLLINIPNALNMETVRGYIDGWYNEAVTDQLPISEGHLSLPNRPGLGIKLRDEFVQRPDARVQVTTEREINQW